MTTDQRIAAAVAAYLHNEDNRAAVDLPEADDLPIRASGSGVLREVPCVIVHTEQAPVYDDAISSSFQALVSVELLTQVNDDGADTHSAWAEGLEDLLREGDALAEFINTNEDLVGEEYGVWIDDARVQGQPTSDQDQHQMTTIELEIIGQVYGTE